MNLSLPEDSRLVKEMFQRFFATESTPARIRAAEPVGFDDKLWRQLLELDAPFIRLAADAGGSGMGLFDACLMMEQAGRRLAPAPLAESVVARPSHDEAVARRGARLSRLAVVMK